ncbi:MAG: hypothetical protein HYZ14_02140 [Bacteroidetes bacterium]|nr:hypothetical protein [Bacteroidota bacterium]
MTLEQLKKILQTADAINFRLPDGSLIPSHFHVTEVGQITKHFIDCGGTVRTEKKVNFQLWEANDFDHRLAAQKLLNIISLSEKTLGIEDAGIEVEYQAGTIGKYDLDFDGKDFLLLNTQTNCLAQDKCGIPVEKLKLKMSDLSKGESTTCVPGSGCCQ